MSVKKKVNHFGNLQGIFKQTRIKIWTNFNCNFADILNKALKKIAEIYKKPDKMWIWDGGTVEKIQRKLEKVLVLGNIVEILK